MCPNIQPPAINDSCFVDITEEVKRLSESFDVNCNEEKYNCPNCGTRLVKKLIYIKKYRK